VLLEDGDTNAVARVDDIRFASCFVEGRGSRPIAGTSRNCERSAEDECNGRALHGQVATSRLWTAPDAVSLGSEFVLTRLMAGKSLEVFVLLAGVALALSAHQNRRLLIV